MVQSYVLPTAMPTKIARQTSQRVSGVPPRAAASTTHPVAHRRFACSNATLVLVAVRGASASSSRQALRLIKYALGTKVRAFLSNLLCESTGLGTSSDPECAVLFGPSRCINFGIEQWQNKPHWVTQSI